MDLSHCGLGGYSRSPVPAVAKIRCRGLTNQFAIVGPNNTEGTELQTIHLQTKQPNCRPVDPDIALQQPL